MWLQDLAVLSLEDSRMRHQEVSLFRAGVSASDRHEPGTRDWGG